MKLSINRSTARNHWYYKIMLFRYSVTSSIFRPLQSWVDLKPVTNGIRFWLNFLILFGSITNGATTVSVFHYWVCTDKLVSMHVQQHCQNLPMQI